MSETIDFEGLLRQALTPVDPPAHLMIRLEGALESITTLAAEELESWELSAMRDPRNWVRPAAALIAGTGAGAALVLLRARRRPGADGGSHGGGASRGGGAAEEAIASAWREMQGQARRLIKRR